ncbi:hypothetical protein GCM10010964_25350 [Caldovatus sediminis]|uniref:Uncharacterized protein n=1 Tax=Caldovatus sediminis TaxID=2041189 RepID=A0A8J2ZBZ7_9PROT|nr:hypothetical protein GCM10010964_25350 [Caldovatus sediminis]
MTWTGIAAMPEFCPLCVARDAPVTAAPHSNGIGPRPDKVAPRCAPAVPARPPVPHALRRTARPQARGAAVPPGDALAPIPVP